MPLISVLGRQKQVYLCEFRASLVYRVSFRTARVITQRNSVLKNQKGKRKKERRKKESKREQAREGTCEDLVKMRKDLCIIKGFLN